MSHFGMVLGELVARGFAMAPVAADAVRQNVFVCGGSGKDPPPRTLHQDPRSEDGEDAEDGFDSGG